MHFLSILSRSVTRLRFSLGHLVIPMSGDPFIPGSYLQTPAHIKCCLNNRESHIDRLHRVVSEQVLHILLLCCSLGYEESIKERILGMWVRMAWGMILRKCEMVITCPYTQSTLQWVVSSCYQLRIKLKDWGERENTWRSRWRDS